MSEAMSGEAQFAGSGEFTLLEGDCVQAMASMEPESIDSIVTDPPYGLEFMGKEWDRFRVDDPGTARRRGKQAGAHGKLPRRGESSVHPAARSGVAYGGGKHPATHRCTGCGKRDQFRNSHRPCGAGDWRREPIDPHAAPPTSLAFQEWCRVWALEAKRVLKPGGHLLAFGGARMHHRLACGLENAGFEIRDSIMWLYGSGFPKSLNVAKAIEKQAGSKSPDAARWQGWGTGLKPAHEPILIARRPLLGTVAENVAEYGTGAINVDACRISVEDRSGYIRNHSGRRGHAVTSSRGGATHLRPGGGIGGDAGRWPANVVMDEQAASELDRKSGVLGNRAGNDTYGDHGGASRFYYSAKASRAERNAGLEGFEDGALHWSNDERSPGALQCEGTNKAVSNFHPTVKPIELMRWLVRLVTPPGGVVLDPFAGSGTTGVAVLLEGFEFIGIENEPDYCRIAEARCRFWAKQRGRDVGEVLRRERRRRGRAERQEKA